MTHILFTFPMKDHLKKNLEGHFPDETFVYSTIEDTDALNHAEIIVTYGEDIKKEKLDLAPHLKWIMVASAGLEKMPLLEIGRHGLFVTNVRGIHKIPMAESVLAHLLALKRSLPWIYDQQGKQEWNRSSNSSELHGNTAIILGPGAIGSEIGRLLQAFGVKTIGCNRSGKTAPNMDSMISFAQLNEYLPAADIVISVLPSTEKTRGLLTYDHFVLMKESAIFMNFGRGDLIKETELMRAMEERQAAFAVLDVFEEEPLEKGHPLWDMEGVIVSPHVSSHSSQYVPRALEIFMHNLKTWRKDGNDYLNVIDVEKGY